MRCRICDSEHTRKWKGDYYCQECREHITKNVRLYRNTEFNSAGELPVLDKGFDDEV